MSQVDLMCWGNVMLLQNSLAPFSQGEKLAEHGHAGGGCSVGDVADGGSSMRTNGVEGGRSWENNGPKLEMRREMIKVRHFLNIFKWVLESL